MTIHLSNFNSDVLVLSQLSGSSPLPIPTAAFLLLLAVTGLLALLIFNRRFVAALADRLDAAIERCRELRDKALHPMGLGRAASSRSPSPPQSLSLPTPRNGGGEEQPSTAEEEQEHGSEVFMVINRLLGLTVALEILLALYVLDASRTGLVVFNGEGGSGLVTIPISISVVLGLLTWAMAIFWGAFLLEVLGVNASRLASNYCRPGGKNTPACSRR